GRRRQRGDHRRAAGRPAGGRLLAGARRALRHDAAGRPRCRGGQGRVAAGRRDAHVDAADPRRDLDLLPRHQPGEALDRARPARPRRRRAGQGARPPCRRPHREPAPGRHGQVRARLRVGGRRQPGAGLRLDLRLRLHRRRARPGLRPHGAGGLGPDEPHRAEGRAALPRRHLHVRRHGRQGRADRHPRRAAPPRRHGPGPARRAEPARVGDVGDGQPELGLRRRRRRAAPHGQRAPQRLPLRAAAHRRQRHRHRRGQRRSVPQGLPGARRARARRRPALRPQRRPHQAPRGAPPAPDRGPVGQGRRRVVRAPRGRGRALRADQHRRRGLRHRRALRPRPRGHRRRGRPRGADHPQPDPLLRHPGDLRAAAARARRARRRAAALAHRGEVV
ncbi:MAG: L-carnitine dehydratase/bile acid-inducible protein F, partial [uncultured Actinomycetospora sp.]